MTNENKNLIYISIDENKFKKALECCAKSQSCIGSECPYFDNFDSDCTQLMATDMLDVLSRKDTEISKLKKSNRNWRRKVQRLRHAFKEMVGETNE